MDKRRKFKFQNILGHLEEQNRESNWDPRDPKSEDCLPREEILVLGLFKTEDCLRKSSKPSRVKKV